MSYELERLFINGSAVSKNREEDTYYSLMEYVREIAEKKSFTLQLYLPESLRRYRCTNDLEIAKALLKTNKENDTIKALSWIAKNTRASRNRISTPIEIYKEYLQVGEIDFIYSLNIRTSRSIASSFPYTISEDAFVELCEADSIEDLVYIIERRQVFPSTQIPIDCEKNNVHDLFLLDSINRFRKILQFVIAFYSAKDTLCKELIMVP
jgi:hypothetical protein